MSDSQSILIVEDDLQISQFLQSSLKANGYHTQCAHSIIDAKNLLNTHKPVLIILDLNLPDGDVAILLRMCVLIQIFLF